MRALKPGLGVLAALALVSVVYGIFWLFMAAELRNGLERWSAARRAEGYQVRFAAFRIGGFPFLLRLDLDRPAFGAPAGTVPWVWQGERAVAGMRPWSPWRVEVAVSGVQTLDLMLAGGAATYAGTASALGGVLVLAGAWPSAADIHIRDLDLSTADGTERLAIGRADLTGRRFVGRDPDHRAPTLDLRLRAKDVRLPRGLSLPLGNRVAGLTLAARVLGAVPPGPLPRSLAAWRDAGGTVEVTRLATAYGPLSLQGTGTLALDGAMQPVGAFTAKIRGFLETVDALRRRGLVRGRDAVTAKLVLGALARTPADGGTPVIDLAITVQNRTLFAGPVPLVHLPAIRWSGGQRPSP